MGPTVQPISLLFRQGLPCVNVDRHEPNPRPLRRGPRARALLACLVLFLTFAAAAALAQAPGTAFAPSIVSVARFDRMAALGAGAPPLLRTNSPAEAADLLLASISSGAGRPSPIDLYCAANAWCAANIPVGRGRLYTRDMRGFGPREYCDLLRNGYRLDRLQAAQLQEYVLTRIGLTSQVVWGEARGEPDSRVWVITEAGDLLLRSDLQNWQPVGRAWRPGADELQLSADLDGVLAFLYSHFPTPRPSDVPGDQARLQGLARPMDRAEWADWNAARMQLMDRARRGENALFVLRPPLPERAPPPPSRPAEAPRSPIRGAARPPVARREPAPTRPRHVSGAPMRRLLPGETRASLLGVGTAGLGTLMHMSEYLRSYSGARTAILSYVVMDGDGIGSILGYLRAQAGIQDSADSDFWPQLPLETRNLTLSEFRKALSDPDSRVGTNVRALARAIARYRDESKWFFIRPFSEMNDGTTANPWEFGNETRVNRPEDMAAAWKLLRAVFNEEGATNAIFIFSPLAAYRVGHEAEVLQALKLIPRGDIDAFGLNVYSRPMTAYGGKSPEPISFQSLADPWLKVLERSPHRGIPLAVAEMAVSNQASDARRAAWLRDAFAYTRLHRFVMVTYFNYPHRYWQVDEGTLAGEALRLGIEGGMRPRVTLAGSSQPPAEAGSTPARRPSQ